MITTQVIGSVSVSTSRQFIGAAFRNFNQPIQKLFANSEQGFWYDPNDLSTMFQDSTGTTPVTAAGQPVGLIRDKSGRNNHAFQTTSASRPILRQNATTGANYLAFDGSDDFLQTGNIDFTATDKVSLFTGLQRLSEATSILMELSTTADVNPNSFFLAATLTGKASFRFYSKAASITKVVNGGAAPPGVAQSLISCVVTVKSAMVNGGAVTLKVNQQSYTTENTTAIGNYGNYPLYIGRRGGTALPFNGHLYSLIGIGKLASDNETAAIEKELAKQAGVTLNV